MDRKLQKFKSIAIKAILSDNQFVINAMNFRACAQVIRLCRLWFNNGRSIVDIILLFNCIKWNEIRTLFY